MQSFEFGSYLLDVAERRLLCGGEPIALTPKAFDVLVYLVERHGRLVTKEDLLQAVWRGSNVEEGSIPRTVHVLRRTLAAGGPGELRYIETVPTKGYRFVAAVTPADSPTLVPSVAARPARPRPWRRIVFLIALLAALGLATFAAPALQSGRGSPAAPGGRQTGNGAAYARVQRGQVHLARHLPGDIDAALNEFESARALDPSYPAAFAGLADARLFRYWNTGAHDDIVHARQAIERTLALDPDSALGHTLLCRLRATYDWDIDGAERACRRAITLDPDLPDARREWAFLLNQTGRRDVALEEMDAAIALAPTSFNKRSRGLLLYFSRRFDEAITQLRQVAATDPEYRESGRWISRAFEQKGDYLQALEALVHFQHPAGAAATNVEALRHAFRVDGWPGVLRATLPPDQPWPPTLESAGTLAQLGRTDAAFEVLESMVQARRVMVIHLDSDPRLDPLRSDDRFERLARRVGLR